MAFLKAPSRNGIFNANFNPNYDPIHKNQTHPLWFSGIVAVAHEFPKNLILGGISV